MTSLFRSYILENRDILTGTGIQIKVIGGNFTEKCEYTEKQKYRNGNYVFLNDIST